MITFIVIYIIGVVVNYYFKRHIYKMQGLNWYKSDVLATAFESILGWWVLLIIYTLKYFTIKLDKKEPPKWL